MAESKGELTPISGSSSSTPNISRQHSFRGSRPGPRQQHKVKFSNCASEEDLSKQPPIPSYQGEVPEIRLAESQDVADQGIPSQSQGSASQDTDAAAAAALSRASRLHNKLNKSRERSSRLMTLPQPGTPQAFNSPTSSPPTKPVSEWPIKPEDISLLSLDVEKRPYALDGDSTDDADDDSDVQNSKALNKAQIHNPETLAAARAIFKAFNGRHDNAFEQEPPSGTQTPAIDKRLHDLDYVPRPAEFHPSPFTFMNKVSTKLEALRSKGYTGPTYLEPGSPPINGKHSPEWYQSKSPSRNGSESHEYSATSSGRITPSKRPKWYDTPPNEPSSTNSLKALLSQSALASTAAAAPTASNRLPRPAYHRARSSQSMIATAVDMIKHPANHFHHKSLVDEEQAVLQIADIVACRKYLKKLARSLMAVGAPSHRLEEYMKTSARALHIDADFLYQPGSMLVSINDRDSMTTEVTLVRENGGVDLGKFRDVFDVYKLVIHGKYTPDQGTFDLDMIMKKRGRHPLALRIFSYGLAAVSVGPFAFSARPVDFAPNFILGSTLGFLQLVVTTRSEQFSHVFEVLSSVLIAFVSRGLGSIYHNGVPVFCFSAIAQSSIALILPGYMVLCAALELQSKSLVAGSVRMVYAIIYSLFLGFGILIGKSFFPCLLYL
jgi:uncharacterized membrane protein YjjP (DUF1212 family)